MGEQRHTWTMDPNRKYTWACRSLVEQSVACMQICVVRSSFTRLASKCSIRRCAWYNFVDLTLPRRIVDRSRCMHHLGQAISLGFGCFKSSDWLPFRTNGIYFVKIESELVTLFNGICLIFRPIQYFQSDGSTTTGRLWSELLHSLTTFSNNCDQNSTIPNELPIVEQIYILHRLDHSIHSMRLWAAAKAKALCTDWSMSQFFQVVQNDINQCLDQIKSLRVPNLVPTDPFEVEVQVNVALRAKLVSEVKVNICKLKLTYSECIDAMAAICKMLSLATLSLCFPKSKHWQCDQLQDQPHEYINHFLNQIYLPVLRATQILEILNLVLRIMCEAWLDYIYMKRIKFRFEIHFH